MSGDVTFDFTVTGQKELEQALEDLKQAGRKSALTAALRAGLKPTAAEARRLAPRGMEPLTKPRKRLHETIVIRARLGKSQMQKLGLRSSTSARLFLGSTDPKAHLVAFGHLLVKAKRTGAFKQTRRGRREMKTKRVIGFVGPRPFLRPAFDADRKDIIRRFGKALWRSVQKVARRYERQAQRGKLSKGARAFGGRP